MQIFFHYFIKSVRRIMVSWDDTITMGSALLDSAGMFIDISLF